jgi:hypothetical protein
MPAFATTIFVDNRAVEPSTFSFATSVQSSKILAAFVTGHAYLAPEPSGTEPSTLVTGLPAPSSPLTALETFSAKYCVEEQGK